MCPQNQSIQPKASHKYFDHTYQKTVVKILPGEFYSSVEDEYITTVLGSCISVCLYDTQNHIGGMNHFMLPQSKSGDWAGNTSAARYGNYAMEHLINTLIKTGAIKHNLIAKIYGGACFQSDVHKDIGETNISFAKDYLKMEDILIFEEDVGGAYSRRITFSPLTGEIFLKKINIINHTIRNRDALYETSLKETPIEGEITLF